MCTANLPSFLHLLRFACVCSLSCVSYVMLYISCFYLLWNYCIQYMNNVGWTDADFLPVTMLKYASSKIGTDLEILRWIVWHSVHSQQHTYMSSSYIFNRLGLSHWDPYAVCRGSCLELYYCNMVEWFWWDSRLMLTTNWFLTMLWHCRFGYLAGKICPQNDL